MTARPSRRERAGYALPVVLAAVAVLALVFASAATALTGLAASARSAVDGAEFQARAMSAEAEAMLQAATLRFAPDGLTSAPSPAQAGAARHAQLRLDGRPYPWGDDPALRLGLQDEAGLLNLDASRPDALLRLFSHLGLSAIEAATLSDRLLDAIDRDDERRPHGAEAADYLARGLPPPRPGGFDGLAEVNAVMDWPTLIDGARRRELAQIATADPAGAAFNANTAPPLALALVLNLSPAVVARIVAAREAAPLTTLAPAGLNIEAAQSPLKPNGRIRFSFADTRRGLSYTSRLLPGADAAQAPWVATGALVERIEPRPTPPDAPPFADPTSTTPLR